MEQIDNYPNLAQLFINVNLIFSTLLICLHLLNKHYQWFSPQVFCIRTILIVFVFNLLILFGYILFVIIKMVKYGKK